LPGSAPVGSNRDISVVSVPEGQIATVTTRSLEAPPESR
jgi:hypothetical protein